MYSTDMVNKEIIHLLGRKEQNDTRFYHTARNNLKHMSYSYFHNFPFHLPRLQVTETLVKKNVNGGIRSCSVF